MEKDYLEEHVQAFHQERYSCPTCLEVFSQKNELEEHLKTGHEVVTFICDHCEFKTEKKGLLRTHMKTQHKNDEIESHRDIYTCYECEKIFSNKRNLMVHIQSIHELIKHPCGQCDYEATQKYDLLKHIKSKHEEVKYACEKCDFKSIGLPYFTPA